MIADETDGLILAPSPSSGILTAMNEARENVVFDVFLSHNSKDKQAVRALAALLADRGIKVWLDEDQLIPGHPWQPLLEKGIRESATGAVLVGADGIGPWEDEEMQALLTLAVRERKPVIPVVLPGAPEKPKLPLLLSNRTWVDLRKGFKGPELANLIWGITGKKPDAQAAPYPAHALEVAVTRLRHGAEHLVGREKELARLDAAWHDPKTHVVTIVAWGGVGKTALVVDWMARMAADGWRGAQRVFDWSFYSQGTSETTSASSDQFLAKALESFGDPDMAKSAAAPWDKGQRLAQLVAERKALLVLDGVEPLQYPPGPVGGKLRDPALEALIKGLAQHNAGLCLVTTREPLTDLAPFHDTTAPEWPLEHLSEEAGAQLLFDAGVTRAGSAQIEAADDKELKAAAHEVRGHALTLQLLGRYLAKVHNGDVRKRKLVAFHKADAKVQGGHAFRMLAAYERWLADAGEEGKRQLAVLHLLGLFDRPADAGCIAALRREPPIEGLTEPLMGLDDDDWNYTLSNLRESGLIATHDDEPLSETSHLSPVTSDFALDAHPLVREYFGKQLRENKPKAWQLAHRRLYEHLCATTTDKKPNPALQDLQPLYQAVAHGCLAGMHQQALQRVYIDRISRGGAAYVVTKLGAFGSDLAAVACFFERLWSALSPQLSESHQAWLLNEAAFHLRALGRLTEALEPMRAATEWARGKDDWLHAAIGANNLSGLELTLGQVDRAIQEAERSVDYADRSGDAFERVSDRAGLADALFQSGQADKAFAPFKEAEAMQAEHEPPYPLLYSLQGFQYCDLLLAPAERAAWKAPLQLRTANLELKSATGAAESVAQRAAQTLRWTEEAAAASLLDFALNHLSLGRAVLYRAILADSRLNIQDSELAEAASRLSDAVDGLHRAADIEFVVRGLLSRALLRFVEKDADACRSDLDEAWQIAERGSMKLFMADVHLHRGRLFRDKAALAEARRLIDACGYHRRDAELADAAEAARGW